MISINIDDILRITKGELIDGHNNIKISGISIDSRKVKKDELFIPIKGERFDGHRFINDALEGGAIAALTSKDIDIQNISDKCIIKVEDTLKALQDISKYILNKLQVPVVAVTGSTGKTTTKELIYNVLTEKYRVLKNEGNYNNHIGLPLTLFNLDNNHEIVVLEMGMSNKGEIDRLCEITNPKVGVITNIGVSHIEKLGSQKGIFDAKMEITNYMDNESLLVVNGDDNFLKGLKNKKTIYDKLFVGLEKDNNITVNDIVPKGEKGIEFQVFLNKNTYNVKLNLPGTHNIYNALLAIGVGMYFDVPIEKIIEGLSKYKGSKMRLNILDLKYNEIKVINDCYNASPDSMEAALGVLQQTESNRRIAVLGDMLELGEYSKELHKKVGYFVKEKNIDILITVGKNAKYIADGAFERGMEIKNIYVLKDNEEANNLLQDMTKNGDSILIKGSRAMKMEEIVQFLLERS